MKKLVKNNILNSCKIEQNFKIVYTGSIYSKENDPVILFDAVYNLIKKKKFQKGSIILEFYGYRLDI